MVTSQTGTKTRQRCLMPFLSVFNTDDRPRESQCPELEDHDCENGQLPGDLETVRDLLLQPVPTSLWGLMGFIQEILKVMTDAIRKPLSMIFEQSWESRVVSANWKLKNIVLIFKKGKKQDPGNYRPVSPPSMPSQVMEKYSGKY
ncbi:RNA-directed DNA polymerase from mobile element jockey [Pitangus sulphuratus]|nr:RNA-directed DNA polymerase from mobile element jockey [Pitangus sulphuratus]